MEINKPQQNAANQPSQPNAPKQAIGTQRPSQQQGGLGRKEQGKNPYNKPVAPMNPKEKGSNLPPR